MKGLETETMVLDCATSVFDTIGPGHSEAVYHRAMEVALRLAGFQYETERVLPIVFRGHVVGNFRCDIVLEDLVVELKAVSRLGPREELQAVNYLKFSGKPRALLLNFGSTLESKKVSLSLCPGSLSRLGASLEPDEDDTVHHPFDPMEAV